MARQDTIIRRATPEDARALCDIINPIAEEGRLTTMRSFSVEEERKFLVSMSDREAIFVAEVGGKAVGMQSIDNPYKWSDKLNHVGMVGTWVMDGYRRTGIGSSLAKATLEFARRNGYEKIVIFVLSDNVPALRYYEGLGFERVGVHRRHMKSPKTGEYKDEVVLELFL